MGWVILLALAAIAGAVLARFGHLPRSGLELLAAALLLALAGYAWQGSPNLPGQPTRAPEAMRQPDSAFAELRGTMMERFGRDADVLATADAFHRQGLDRYAVGIIKGALTKNPRSADLWVGLGNALVLHNEGVISPAARLAFDRAARLSPAHPAPPFFTGLAYAQLGQFDRARDIWSRLLARTPPRAPWRRDLELRLAMLDAVEARAP